MYSKEVNEHIANPRNVGDVENPSGVGDVTNQVCLDRIRLSIKVDNGILTEAKFKANGCPPTMAAASVLTELITGRSVKEAALMERTDIVSVLGRLPPAKMHCAMLAIDALQAALKGARRTV
jgi:NifU-like protein involved in Fe-S cluster formation